MDNLKKDDLEIDKNLEENENKTEIETEKTEEQETVNENVEVKDIEDKGNFDKVVESKVDFKEKFDKIISKKNLLEYIMGGISAVFVLNLLYIVIKLIGLGSYKSLKINSENVLSGFAKTMSKIESLKTIVKLRDFSHFLIFLSIVLISVIYYKTVVLEKRKDFIKKPTNINFLGGNVIAIISSLILKISIKNFSTFMLYIAIIIYLVAIATFAYNVYTLYLELFKNQKN